MPIQQQRSMSTSQMHHLQIHQELMLKRSSTLPYLKLQPLEDKRVRDAMGHNTIHRLKVAIMESSGGPTRIVAFPWIIFVESLAIDGSTFITRA